MNVKRVLFIGWLRCFAEAYKPSSSVLHDRLNQANDIVGQICNFSGVPGASIGALHNGEVVHTFNYGQSDVAANINTTSDTVFSDTPVKLVLPEFEQVNTFIEENLAVADILSYRSGLAGFGDMNMAFQGDGDMLLPKSSLFDLVRTFSTQFPLRSDWSYFVWGYALAGEIIQRLSGMDLSSYIRETLLQPLGLNATTFDPDSVEKHKFAKPYAGLADGTAFELSKLQAFKDTFFEASGGLYSSANDMMRWCKVMLQALRFGSPVIKGAESLVSNHAPIENPSLTDWPDRHLGTSHEQTPPEPRRGRSLRRTG